MGIGSVSGLGEENMPGQAKLDPERLASLGGEEVIELAYGSLPLLGMGIGGLWARLLARGERAATIAAAPELLRGLQGPRS